MLSEWSSSLSPVLRKYIRFFQLLGLFSLSLSSSSQKRCRVECLHRAWSLLWFLLFNSTVLYIITSNEEFLYSGDSFGYFNDALKLAIAHVAVMIIYLESFLQRKPLNRFWTLYAGLKKSRSTFLGKDAKSWRHHRRFLVIFFVINAVNFICGLTFILVQDFSRHLMLFWSMFTPYIYVVHFRNMQVILHVEIMRLELEFLRQDVHLLVEYTRFGSRVSTFPGFEEFIRRKLLYKQKVYTSIYEMFESFQSEFGFSIVAGLLMVSVRVLVDSYFMFYTNYRDVDRLAENLLIIPALFEVPVFLLTARNCMNVVKHISYELHNILSQIGGEGTLSTQIQNFSLQILHQKIRIDGVGLTTMDGYMLMRAVGSVTAYIFFFIQFMPKFRNI